MRNILLLLLLCVSELQIANAREDATPRNSLTGVYAGVGAGAGFIKNIHKDRDLNLSSAANKLIENGSIFIGTSFSYAHAYMAAELNGILSSEDFNRGTGYFSNRGSLVGNFGVSLFSNTFAIYSIIGVGVIDFGSEIQNKTSVAPVLGAGFRYAINHKFSLAAEWNAAVMGVTKGTEALLPDAVNIGMINTGRLKLIYNFAI